MTTGVHHPGFAQTAMHLSKLRGQESLDSPPNAKPFVGKLFALLFPAAGYQDSGRSHTSCLNHSRQMDLCISLAMPVEIRSSGAIEDALKWPHTMLPTAQEAALLYAGHTAKPVSRRRRAAKPGGKIGRPRKDPRHACIRIFKVRTQKRNKFGRFLTAWAISKFL